ncbi:glycosyltransferase [Clostridioides sp. ES-S-0145-01]|uniref:tetratricopeptide repeat-containing glycosyltransferase family 2 protein n=1 Tax=Clostridioides sp. ES-S-0145-01 TaxID=2770784 RepID=UPI001D10DE38|nr:glycosyltransferase [Clostridioides sp. ES-S-0145-01]
MLLSIVMIVRNEEKILKKMLESLTKLRNSIENELIIVDTGSTDNTVEIAKNYTNNVYFHEWDSDFSNMRNKSISYAKGKWIFILDADEVLIDCTKLIEFFNCDMHKKFNSASINLKNIYSLDKDSYGYSSVLRLFKNEDFKYIGKVHEQPLYKNPIFHNIAYVDHYGYIFEDEEIRLCKVKRNEELLFSMLENDKEDPYVNYQLGKNFIILGKYQDALFYLEKSNNLYRKFSFIPGYVTINLAKTYLALGEYKKCEKLCLKYIEKDRNNIDIYYHLAQAQVSLSKYENSIDSYKRFIYLSTNYDVSTQTNSLFSDVDSIGLEDNAVITIIKIYYKLEKYNSVLEEFENIIDEEKKREVYFCVFMSLYKLNMFKNILDYYKKLPNSLIERKIFYEKLESFIQNIKESDKDNIYKILSMIEGSYGEFNRVRLSKNVSLNQCIKFLKLEQMEIYSPIIIIASESNINIFDILCRIDYIWIEKYIHYSLSYDRKFAFKLYKDILEHQITFDINKIMTLKILSKVVLDSNALNEKRYKELFYLYIMYSYQYIKKIYASMEDKQLLKYINSDLERFVLKFKLLGEVRNNNEKKYLEDLKALLNEYPYYNKIIKILIKDLERELEEKNEFKILKKEFLNNIEKIINSGDTKNSKQLIDEYVDMFGEELEILNIKGIVNMMNGNYEDAGIMFKKAYSLDMCNDDIIFNIQYLIDSDLLNT